MRRISCVLVAVLALAVDLSVSPEVMAQQRYDDASMKELQRFNIDVGGFLIANYDTTVRFDSTSVPIGTVIDFEDTLNVDSSSSTARIDGFYRFNRRHRLDWTYYVSRRSGDTLITEDITIGDPDDPDGQCIIGAGASTASMWDFDLLKVGYSYSFLNTRRYELFLGGGFNIRDFDISIDAEGNLTGCEEEEDGGYQIESGGIIPLPTVNFGGRWNFTPKLQARWQWQVFALKFGEYHGSTSDTLVLVEHRTFEHVGFGVGLNSFDLLLEAESDDLRGEITSRYLGLLAYIKAYF